MRLSSYIFAAALALSLIPAAHAAGPTPDEIKKAFLAGKTEELEKGLADLKDSAVPLEDNPDITYIRQAFADARPSWWPTIKTGRTQNFAPKIWNRTLNASFDPSAKNSIET